MKYTTTHKNDFSEAHLNLWEWQQIGLKATYWKYKRRITVSCCKTPNFAKSTVLLLEDLIKTFMHTKTI